MESRSVYDGLSDGGFLCFFRGQVPEQRHFFNQSKVVQESASVKLHVYL